MNSIHPVSLIRTAVIMLFAVIVLAFSTASSRAGSVTLGDLLIKGEIIDIDWGKNQITVQKNASIVSLEKSKPQPGKIRFDSLTAQSIRINAVQDKKGNLTLSEAIASGSVTIKARRVNITEDESGQTTAAITNINATAQSANMNYTKDEIILSRKVQVKLTEAGKLQPVGLLTGDKITFSLKDDKMRVEGKPAEAAVTLKES